jgi:photosystem II stability/assembly factor-like uncharacterized protein
MGASGGGVWKTVDGGLTWRNVSDGWFATGSIGAIRTADSSPDVVYVGTGSDGLRSNVIIGKGVYRSDDGGTAWRHLGLEDVGNIGAVLIHPENPELVYVAAIGNPFAPNSERGVYRSRDGGGSWQKVLFVSERTGAVDLELAPDDADQIYACMWLAERKPWTIISGGLEGGVYTSRDGGDSWQQLTEGLPTGLRGKADLAVSAGDPERVYVLIEAPGDEGGLYRSDDRGTTWRQVSDFDKIRTRPFYYCNLEVHPTNPDILWAMSEGFWRSEDAGETWKKQRTPHGDNHDMWINPAHPDLFIQANDGGANVTLNGGKSWTSQYNQPTAELYQVDVSDGFPYRLYAGQQDNTTISVPSFPARAMPGGHTALWEDQGGCETGPAVPKPGDPDIVYTNCKGRFGVFNRRTGQEQQYYVGFANLYGHNPKDLEYRFQRVAPIHVSPHDPDRVYHGSQLVHVTEDGGMTWQTISPDLTANTPETRVVSGTPITIDVTGEEHFAALYEIQESPHEPGVIWVGANDGPIHLTRDGGATWTEVTPAELGPHGRVQTIEVSPHDPAAAYVAILRYQLGDFSPYVYATRDYGANWQRLTTGDNGIPEDVPVRVVREDPQRPGLLYAGTEFGMYISFNGGAQWQDLQLNLPVTPVTDLKLVHHDLVLSTMGRGFWILYDRSPLLEASTELAAEPAHLFAVQDAVRRHAGGRWRRPSADPARPQYPAVGASINYYLAEEASGDMRVEIFNDNGALVREIVAETPEPEQETKAEDPDYTMESPDEPAEKPGPQTLQTTAGVHRVVWDLRHTAPAERQFKDEEEEDDDDRSKLRGPVVAPGTYEARLQVGEWSARQRFEVVMDPRVEAEGIGTADVTTQAHFALAVRDAVTRAREAADRIEEALQGLEQGEPSGMLDGLKAKLITHEVRYSQPMLLDQLEYLYRNHIGADQLPGAEARRRFTALEDELAVLLDDLEPTLNAQKQD